MDTYLIFVIFLHEENFLENRIYTEKCVNYNKQISRKNSVNQDLLGQATKNVCELYTLSVKARLVCVNIENTHKLHKVSDITL